MTVSRNRILTTSHGTHRGAFGAPEWGLLAAVALMWGSSFLFIDIGLEAFRPGLITLIRVLIGASILWMMPRARAAKVERQDLPRLVAVSVLWIAIPLSLFPIGQQYVDSAVAGMLNSVQPIVAGLAAALMLRKAPGRNQLLGLLIGLTGAALISIPSVGEGSARPIGVILLLGSLTCYAIAVVIATPLQQKYGSIAITSRMLAIGAVFVLPGGLLAIAESRFDWGSLFAILALGIFGTVLAQLAMFTLIGRAGATRASFTSYLVPIVAIILGVTLRGDHVARLALIGIFLTLAGAALASRREI